MEKHDVRRRHFIDALKEKQTHYRLYKGRHGWLVMGITTIGLAVGLALTPQTVQADDETPTDSTAVIASQQDPAVASLGDVASVRDGVVGDATAADVNPDDMNSTESAANQATTDGEATSFSTSVNDVSESAPTDATSVPPATTEDVGGRSSPTSGITAETTVDAVAPELDEATTPTPASGIDEVMQLDDTPTSPAIATLSAETPQTLLPAPTTPDSAVITEQVRQDGIDLNLNPRESTLTPDGKYRTAAVYTYTPQPTEPVYSETIKKWLANPIMANYSLSISNMRLVDGHWETTQASVVTVTVPDQTISNNTGIAYNTTLGNGNTGMRVQFHWVNTNFSGTGVDAAIFYVNRDLVPGTNDAQISMTGPITITMAQTGSLGINIRNQTDMLADGGFGSFQPWVSFGLVTAPTSYQLTPTITDHGEKAPVLSGLGTGVGNTITVYSRDSQTTATTTVDATGNWSIDRNTAGFLQTERLYVIESNNLGDIPGVAADVEFGLSYQENNAWYGAVETGKLLGTDTFWVHWVRTPTVTLDAAGKAVFETIEMAPWVAVGDATYPEYTWPTYPNVYPVWPTVPETPAAEPGTGITNNMLYLDLYQVVTPDGPEVQGVSHNALTESVLRTVSFVDNFGNQIETPEVQELKFTRNVVINMQTQTVDHYTDWVPVTSNSFDAVLRKDIDDYFTLTKQIDSKTVSAEDADLTAEFVYFPREVTVTPDMPKTEVDLIDPNHPDGPTFPTGVAINDLNLSSGWTVMYVRYDTLAGLASTTHQTTYFTRNAVVKFDLDGNVSEIEYGDWFPTTSMFTSLPSVPRIPSYVTTQTSVTAPVLEPGKSQTDYVKYYPATITVQPPIDPTGELAVTPGTPTVPGDDNSPKYPDDLAASDLVNAVTRTIHFITKDGQVIKDPEVQTVYFKRTLTYNYSGSLTNPAITYGAWVPYATSAFASFETPEITDYFTYTKNIPTLVTQAEADPVSVDVIYYPATVKVPATDPKTEGDLVDPTDPAGPKYPAGVTKDDLNKTVSVVIHYVEAADHTNELQQNTTQDLAFSREATVHYAPDGTATVTYADYQPNTQDSAGLASLPVIANWVTTATSLDGIAVSADSGQLDQYVNYYPALVDIAPPIDPIGPITVTPGVNIDPTDPGSPKYPDTLKLDDFVNTVTRTINYVANTGELLSESLNQVLNFKRTVSLDYSADVSNPKVIYGDWQAYTTSQFASVDSPLISKYFTYTKMVDALDTKADSQPVVVDVIYFPDEVTVPSTDPKQPGDLVDPTKPNGPTYPEKVDDDSLNKTITVTIRFVDGRDTSVDLADSVTQTVDFARDAVVHFDQDGKASVTYENWQPVTATTAGLTSLPEIKDFVTAGTTLDGLELNADNADTSQLVHYYPAQVTVMPPTKPDGDFAVVPGDSTVPGDALAPKYPTDLSTSQAVTQVIRTIHYVDEAGEKLTDDAVQTLYFKREIYLDYAQDFNKPTVTYGDWTAYTTNEFEAVTSPILTNYYTEDKLVNSTTVGAGDTDIEVTVVYKDRFVTVKPEGPFIGDITKDQLNETVTQTINYLKPDGTSAATTHVASLAFTRTALVNAETGAIVSFGLWSPVTTDTFDEVVSPTFTDLFTTTKRVDETMVKADAVDIVINVQYDNLFVVVGPDGPFVGPTSKEMLHHDVVQTIHFVDDSGDKVADDAVAKLAFTRTATVNVETETIVDFSNWQAVGSDTFAEVVSPVLDNLFTSTKTIEPITVKGDTADLNMTVTYNDLYVVVAPDGPYIGETSKELLNHTVMQTIHYVLADGSEAAVDHVASLAFTRTATINVETGKVTDFGDWQAVNGDTFAIVVSPEIADQFTNTKQIDAVQVAADADDLVETVTYQDLYVTVQPEGPDYPGASNPVDLHQTVKQTIHYVKADGSEAASDHVATLAFTRTAKVNVETGAVVDYGQWQAGTTDTFAIVVSPIVENLFTTTKQVEAQTVDAEADDIVETVVYQDLFVTVPPDGPAVGDVKLEDLRQQVMQTIHYVKPDGSEAAPDHVTTLAFTRNATVNVETGEVVDYGEWQPATTNTFAVVTSPTVANLFTTTKQVDALTVKATDLDVETEVAYLDLYVTVEPDGEYVGETSKDLLNQNVTQTIHYFLADGSQAAEDHVVTLAFTRTAIVNVETGKVEQLNAWVPTTTDTFVPVESPKLTNLYPSINHTDALKVDAETADVALTVDYQDLYVIVEPEGEYVGNTSKALLNQSVTRTIHYVDATGKTVADDHVERLAFTRTAKVNVQTGEVVELGEWQAVTSDTFAAVTSPEVADMFTTTKLVASATVEAEADDLVAEVVYQNQYVTVQPDGPFIGESSKQDQNRTITQTIHYVNADGTEASPDHVATLAFVRTATVNVETGVVVSHGDWQAVSGDAFAAVISPTFVDQYTTTKQIDAATVTAESSDLEATVHYQALYVTVQPDGPYTGNTSQANLNQSVTQTIHYVDVNGKMLADDAVATLTFTRTAKVNVETGVVVEWGTWQAVNGDTFTAVVSPTLPDLFTTTKQIAATKVTAEAEDLVENVVYQDLYIVIKPGDPYPNDPSVGETIQDQIITDTIQVIRYVKPDVTEAAPEYSLRLEFTRTAKVNVETNEVVSYTDWVATNGDTFKEVVSPVFDELYTTTKKIAAVTIEPGAADINERVEYSDLYTVVQPDGPFIAGVTKDDLNQNVTQTIHYVKANGTSAAKDHFAELNFTRTAKVNLETQTVVAYSDWEAVSGDTFAQVVSPDVVDMYTTTKQINAIQVNADSDDLVETVIYQELYVIVPPDGPYVGEATEAKLNHTVTQTIHYVLRDGSEAAVDNVATLAFKRSVKANVETGMIAEYLPWQAVTTNTFAVVVSPVVPDQFTDTKQVVAVQVTGDSADLEQTVTYRDLYQIVEPDGPYVGETTKDQLNVTITQTIHYVKVDGTKVANDHVTTLNFTRTAKVNLETGKVVDWGDWQAADGNTFTEVPNPTFDDLYTTRLAVDAMQVDAEADDVEVTVTYNDLFVTVDPDGPFIGETTESLLNQAVTRTIHYVDSNGKSVAEDNVKTLAFTRTAKVNVQTGKVIDFGDWQAVDTDTFEAVTSPAVAEMFTTTKEIKAVTVIAGADDLVETVTYTDLYTIVQPDGLYVGEATKDKLNAVVTRTIHYVDADGTKVAADNVATLGFVRTAKVNLETGKVVDWGDWQATDGDTFVEVTSPTFVDQFTTDKLIAAKTVTGDSKDIEVTVNYRDRYVTVDPDGPFIGDATKDYLNKVITRTIHYVKADGSMAAKDDVATIRFTRIATVNVETGEVERVTAWQSVGSATFVAVLSPTITGFIADQLQIEEQPIDANSADLDSTVTYTPIPAPKPQPVAPKPKAPITNPVPGKLLSPAVINPATAGNDQMPATSDSQNLGLALLGWTLSGMIAVGAWLTGRKKKG
jgi:hypothetical protein